jgi:hypothetical protein
MHKWSDFWVFNGEKFKKKEKNTRFVHLILIGSQKCSTKMQKVFYFPI